MIKSRFKMKTRKALIGSPSGGYESIGNLEVPKPGPGMVLCKVFAIALNPVDAKIGDYSPAPGAVGGHDFSGEVVKIGENVKKLNIGDRIFAVTFGLNQEDKSIGAFSEYALAIEDLSCRLPASMSFDEASTFGVGIGTAGCSLFQYLNLPMPDKPANKSFYVLVSGGATATGMYAIQLLKASGLKPIATCSAINMEMVKELGAVKAFDYHSQSCGTDIRNYTEHSLAFALDCVTTSETMSMCYQAIGRSGGRYMALEPFSTQIKYTRRDIHSEWIMVHTLTGSVVKMVGQYGRPALPADREFASRFYSLAERLIHEGVVKASPYDIRTGGLDKIQSGIEDIHRGRVKGRKLVYPLL
ncbi:GroES-like protein [Xylariaceae sp. FL0662B]|nr:GroES-like protein [Xylariaceae sp. FL0662B]